MNQRLPTLAKCVEVLEQFLPEAIDLRKKLHSSARVGGQEECAAQFLAELLGQGDAPSIADGRILRFGPAAGRSVALRAELDALPIVEATDVSWAATNGAMHACGHDVHLAALVAVIRTLVFLGTPVPVVAVLQPREETYPCGAPDIIGSKEWRANDVAAVVAAHIQPALAHGSVSAPPGPVNASSDEFFIRVQGAGGHAAYPHTLRDPVVAAAAIVSMLQQLISRRSDPMDHAVISVGSIHGGSAANVIPEFVDLRGTLRTFSETQRANLITELETVATHVALAHGCAAEFSIVSGEPVLTNEESLSKRLAPKLRELHFNDSEVLRSCGADDFAYYGEAAPAVMVFVGTGDTGSNSPGLHQANFLPGDESIGDIARVLLAGFLAAAEQILESGQNSTALATTRGGRYGGQGIQ